MAGFRSSRQAQMVNRLQLRPVRSNVIQTTDEVASGTRKFGPSYIVAMALALLDLRVVHRGTLRALLPKGTTHYRVSDASAVAARLAAGKRPTSKENKVTDTFQKILYKFDLKGWISRGQEFVLVRDHRALFDWATAVEWPDDVAISVGAAISEVERSLGEDGASPAAKEQRRQELIRLKALMEQGFGEHWSGRGSVRFVPRGRSL